MTRLYAAAHAEATQRTKGWYPRMMALLRMANPRRMDGTRVTIFLVK